MTKVLFTSESVTEGHPDKVCDQISDAVLDACLAQDPDSRVAAECLAKSSLVVVAGEITTKAKINVRLIAKNVLKEIGYTHPKYGIDAETCSVISHLEEQSPDISMGVDHSEAKEQGAGDQGMMFGYATNETPELMPLPIVLAHKLTEKLSEVRKKQEVKFLGPDGKSQVTVEYVDNKPSRVDAVVVSAQHDEDVSLEIVRKEILEKVVGPVCGHLVDANTKFFINPTGRFVRGGPYADSGLTGRKIIVDSYGGMGRHGGGAFCLAGNSLINTEKGLVSIDSCQYIAIKGLLVKTDIHPMPSGAWYDNGVKPTELIITEDGYELEATLNHNIRTIDNYGNYVWKPVEELKIGDWIAIQSKNRLFGGNEIAKFIYEYKEGTAEGRKKKYSFPTKLTSDYAYLLGLLVGDGDCTDEGCIKLCVCEEEMKIIVENLFEKLFNDKGKIYGHWAYIGGVELRAYLKHLGLTYAKSFEKTVPSSIFQASKESCSAFLMGLFDTDGCVRIDGRNNNSIRIHFASTSHKLVKEVQILLLNLGIISTIRPVYVEKKKAGYIRGRKILSAHTRYDLVLKGSKSIELFKKEIGFNLPRKQKILESDFGVKRNFQFIPNQRTKIIRLFKKLPLEEQRKDVCKIGRFTRQCYGKATKELTYEKLKEFIEAYEQFFKNDVDFLKLHELFLMNHYYSKIKTKIPSFAHTFDLNIPFSHTFTANGIVCHNSGKDASKVDRSGAYAARYIAKNIVASGLAERCEVQLAYAIGVAEPVSIHIDTFGTGKISEEKISELVRKHFPLKPKQIIDELQLKRPIYRKTASYGHFGRNEPEFTWERTDKVELLKKDALQ